MKNWEKKKLGDICEFVRGPFGGSLKKNIFKPDGFAVYEQQHAIYDQFDDIRYFIDENKFNEMKRFELKAGDLIMSCSGTMGKVAIVPNEFKKGIINQALLKISPSNKISNLFLKLWMQSESFQESLKNYSGGAAIQNVASVAILKGIEIPLPTISEQQRIVSILDECFATIDKAKSNAEQNLKNAKELFESYLQRVFENGNWETKTIQEISKVINGYAFASKDFKPTNTIKSIKITNVGVKEFVEEADNYLPEKFKETLKDYQIREGNIVIALTRTIISAGLKVAVVPASYDGALVNQRVAALAPKEKIINQRYLYNFLTTDWVTKYVLAHVNTLMQPNLSINDLKNLPIPCPSLNEQNEIVSKLDGLRNEVEKLKSVYQQKVNDLEELKKSILQKAFTGELKTSNSLIESVAKVIPLQKVEGISTTDLQAGITALALQKHIEQNQQRTFHHVKAEKIVHLSEYILNIDLERNPVKDAAGPNDFPHAKKVESRARKAGFYTVFKNGEYYDYTQGRSINSVIQKTQNCLGEKINTLSQIISILVPMSTQQAEIVATVYAAWNNLILQGHTYSNEDIILEARENWHAKKKDIPREKFSEAIRWMRKNELLIPKGNGKIVIAK